MKDSRVGKSNMAEPRGGTGRGVVKGRAGGREGAEGGAGGARRQREEE